MHLKNHNPVVFIHLDQYHDHLFREALESQNIIDVLLTDKKLNGEKSMDNLSDWVFNAESVLSVKNIFQKLQLKLDCKNLDIGLSLPQYLDVSSPSSLGLRKEVFCILPILFSEMEQLPYQRIKVSCFLAKESPNDFINASIRGQFIYYLEGIFKSKLKKSKLDYKGFFFENNKVALESLFNNIWVEQETSEASKWYSVTAKKRSKKNITVHDINLI